MKPLHRAGIVVFFILLFVFIFSSNLYFAPVDNSPKVSFLGENPVTVQVEVADEPGEHAQGLMFRESLPFDQGMVFIFEQEKPVSFWMKNTLIPLDMIFLDSDLKIVTIHSAEPCNADPCPTYSSTEPAQYVVEVNGGFADHYDIKVGDVVFVSIPESQ